MKFTHILGLSSIYAIGMATKMVRKAKEQHCKKKQVFVRFIHWNANKRSCYQILRILRKIWFAGKTAKKLGRPAQNYFLISNSKIQKQFFGNFVIPDRKKSIKKLNFKWTCKNSPKQKIQFPNLDSWLLSTLRNSRLIITERKATDIYHHEKWTLMLLRTSKRDGNLWPVSHHVTVRPVQAKFIPLIILREIRMTREKRHWPEKTSRAASQGGPVGFRKPG